MTKTRLDVHKRDQNAKRALLVDIATHLLYQYTITSVQDTRRRIVSDDVADARSSRGPKNAQIKKTMIEWRYASAVPASSAGLLLPLEDRGSGRTICPVVIHAGCRRVVQLL